MAKKRAVSAKKKTPAARKRAAKKATARRARTRATRPKPGPQALATVPKTTRSRPGGTPPGEVERIAVRRMKAVALRLQGETYRQIADELDVSLFTAHEDVNAELMAVCQETRADTEHMRTLILERSDFALRGLKAAVVKGDPSSCRAWNREPGLEARMGGLIKPPDVRPGDDSPTSPRARSRIVWRLWSSTPEPVGSRRPSTAPRSADGGLRADADSASSAAR